MSPLRACVFFLCSLLLSSAADLKWHNDERAGLLELRRGDKPVLTWAFASNQFKPYIKSLRAMNGEEVLRDAPADHLHHHGLMYAIRVNGVNFWEERDNPGHQKHIRWLATSASSGSAGPARANATELIHWVTETNASALLIERRTIEVLLDDARQQLTLRWRGEFEVGRVPVKLHGSDYNGLGIRLPEQWDRKARHRNSENLPYTAEQKWDVISARWAAVSQDVNGREMTLALFNHPKNRGEAKFFSMLNPFTYVAVTQNLSKTPIEYGPGEKFAIEYLLVVFSKPVSAEEIARAGASFIQSENNVPSNPH